MVQWYRIIFLISVYIDMFIEPCALKDTLVCIIFFFQEGTTYLPIIGYKIYKLISSFFLWAIDNCVLGFGQNGSPRIQSNSAYQLTSTAP